MTHNISMEEKKLVIDVVIDRLLKYMGEQNLTQYAIAKKSNLPFGTVKSIMQRRAKGVELKTIIMLSHGLGITPWEFIQDPSFLYDNLSIE